MSERINVHISKIMRTPIKLGVRTYATYANCRTLCVNKLFLCTARLWNSLPIGCFHLTYDTNGFKYKINRHLLSLGSLYIDFLYVLIFLYFFFVASQSLFNLAQSESQFKKIVKSWGKIGNFSLSKALQGAMIFTPKFRSSEIYIITKVLKKTVFILF